MNRLLQTSLLLESITHIEDLPLKEFIRTIESLKDKIITEKLDGANLWFGVDENGVYTSREGKSPKKGRFYDVKDYAMVSNYNGFRAAHLALENVAGTIKKYFKEGDSAEIEVLFGRQPNTVTYGSQNKNYIVILRGVNDTPDERVQALAKALNDKTTTVESTIVFSPDGETIELRDEKLKWQFTQVKPMDAKTVDTKQAMKLLGELKKYMALPNDLIKGKTNEEVAEMSMTSVPKAEREPAKKEKEKVNAYIMDKFKAPIKELLLNNFVRKIKPFLQSDNLHPSEDIGVEGVVVRDPVSGSQTKIVDKDVFTAINTFNSSVRSSVAGLVRTTDQDAAAEMRGGAFGQAKIRIAELLGAKELAMSSGVKRFIMKFKKSDPHTTAMSLATSLNITSLPSIRTKISAILTNTLEEVNGIVGSFKKDAGEYKLKLKTGKEIGISPEIMKRTLTALAETKKDIAEINANVLKSRDATDLVMALYGRTIETIFSEGETEVKESYTLLKSLHEDGEGATGAGAVGGAPSGMPAGTPVAGTTSSANIQPFQSKLFGERNIIKRKRGFEKPKKFPRPIDQAIDDAKTESSSRFSLIKSMNEDWAHVSDMKFATDVDDAAAASNDIEFKQLRNNVNIGDNVTQMDVNNYLDKAHDINDEVDTVTFGMESDDGSIVKVYVNASQADEFEKALAQALGEEDDVEQVINDMSNKFDIVDVEWPQEMTEPLVEPEVPSEDEGETTDEVPSEEGETPEIDFSTTADEPPADETSSDEPEIDFSTTADEPPADDSSDTSEEEPAEEPPAEEEPADDESDTEEEPSDEEPELDADGNPVKKKKPKAEKTEEAFMQTIGEKFKQKLLTEARVKKPVKGEAEEGAEDKEVVAARSKYEDQVKHLMASFPTRQDKAIITLMITLGVPIRSLTLHKAEVRQSIDGAADLYMKNSSFRLWTRKLLAAINDAGGKVSESSIEGRMSNKYQIAVYVILKALGMPDSVESMAQRVLIAGIREKAKLAMSNTSVRMYLMTVAEILGVDGKIRNAHERDLDIDEVKESYQLEEDAKSTMATVSKFLTTLGFDPTANKSIQMQMNSQTVKMAISKLGSAQSLVSKLDALTGMIATKTKMQAEPEQPAQPGQPASAIKQFAGLETSGRVINEEKSEWVISKLGKSGGLHLASQGVTIKIDADEAGKLEIGLDSGKNVSVVDKKGDRYTFKPGKKGTFAVGKLDDEDFQDDLELSKDDVQSILDLITE